MKKLLPLIFTALALLSSCTSVKPDVQADRTALNEEESVQPVYKGLKRKVAIAGLQTKASMQRARSLTKTMTRSENRRWTSFPQSLRPAVNSFYLSAPKQTK